MSRVIAVLGISVLLAGCQSIAPEAIAGGQWAERTPMPTPRSEMPAALLDGIIYVPGGLGGPETFEAYDPVADTWTTLAPLPEGRHHFMFAAFDGKLYTFGGSPAGSFAKWEAQDNVWVYDPATDSWDTDLTPLPEPRLAGAAVAHDNYIYVVGGTGGSRALLRYDPAHDEWAALADMGYDTEHTAAVVLGDEIYVLAGRWQNDTITRVVIYDIAADRWREGPALNLERAGHAATVLNGKIYVFGGEVLPDQTHDSVEILDPVGGQWAMGVVMPYTLHGVPAVTFEGRIYVIGGSDRVASATNRGRVLVFEP